MTHVENEACPAEEKNMMSSVSEASISEALETLEKYAREQLTEAAEMHITAVLRADFGVDNRNVVQRVLNSWLVQDCIEHHTEKVLDLGFNHGRLAARKRFMIEDWSIEGRGLFLKEICGVLADSGTTIELNAAKRLLVQGWEKGPPPLVLDPLRTCSDIAPSDVCQAYGFPEGSTFAAIVAELSQVQHD